jgi:GNAT superfamily N-acetyltransferase
VQKQTSTNISIKLLADQPELIAAVGELRWRDWGNPADPDSLDEWVKISEKEAGYDRLPVTWVAIDDHGQTVGVIGLDEFDIDERRDRSPWVVGVIVAADRRSTGIGSQLMAALEAFAHSKDYSQLWVATGGRAVNFYQKCGWKLTEIIERPNGEKVSILARTVEKPG